MIMGKPLNDICHFTIRENLSGKVEILPVIQYFHPHQISTTMNTLRYSLLFLSLALLLLGACKGTKTTAGTSPAPAEKAFTPSGTWTYEVLDLPDGDATGEMTLTPDGSGFIGSISSELGEASLDDVSIEDKSLNCSFSVQGYEAEINGDFEGDSFSGKLSVAGYEFPMTATRKK